MQSIELLEVRFHLLTSRQLIQSVFQAIEAQEKIIIANVNVHAMNLAYELDWYRDFLNQAKVVFCDGFGVALAAKLAGYQIKPEHRSTCPDWIEALALECQNKHYSLFLLGGKPGVAKAAATKLKISAPNLMIETHHGYFSKTDLENERVIAKINAFKPNILYVGFGMPLQEAWIKDSIDKIEANVFMPLGACLDFYTEQVYRGPQWLTGNGLEWLTRLVTEPRRLWQRYLLGNPLFIYRVLKQRLLGR